MSDDSARNFMNVSKRFAGQIPNGSDFTPTVLYALAAPSTPNDVVQAAVERAARELALRTMRNRAMGARREKRGLDALPLAGPRG